MNIATLISTRSRNLVKYFGKNGFFSFTNFACPKASTGVLGVGSADMPQTPLQSFSTFFAAFHRAVDTVLNAVNSSIIRRSNPPFKTASLYDLIPS